MHTSRKSALIIALLAALAVPAGAVAADPPDNPGTENAAAQQADHAPVGPNATLPAKAKAYGKYCQGESKTHVAGQPGTPFSKCVTAMAKLATDRTDSPRVACAQLSKTHTAGQTGSPFSQCVKAGAKLLKDQQQNP
jgi:invasion protein IalB